MDEDIKLVLLRAGLINVHNIFINYFTGDKIKQHCENHSNIHTSCLYNFRCFWSYIKHYFNSIFADILNILTYF